MSGNKVVKSVSFNITNEKDAEYLKRIENVNFSGYVKRLIEKDIRSRRIIKTENSQIQEGTDGHTIGGPIMTKGTTLTLMS